MNDLAATAESASLGSLPEIGAEPPEWMLEKLEALDAHLQNVIRGKPEVIRYTLVAMVSNGHLLLEDVPGVGKTTLALALATFLGCTFSRIQFTSDLLPTDILGVSLFNQQESRFEFRSGPIFSNIVLADELNRTTPKTQSCLLEAMSDGRASIDGVTRTLPEPFLVIATQNPIEHHGTFPLPESQLDLFIMRVRIGYPERAAERAILRGIRRPDPGREEAVMTPREVIAVQEAVTRVRVSEDLADYLLAIVEETRSTSRLALGVSPRGAQHLYRTAQASAFLDGRGYVVPDDIKRLALPVLSHRIVPSGMAGLVVSAEESEALVTELMERVPVPE